MVVFNFYIICTHCFYIYVFNRQSTNPGPENLPADPAVVDMVGANENVSITVVVETSQVQPAPQQPK